jgi:hypothetical protein
MFGQIYSVALSVSSKIDSPVIVFQLVIIFDCEERLVIGNGSFADKNSKVFVKVFFIGN